MYKNQMPGYPVLSPATAGFRTRRQNGTPIVTTPAEIDLENDNVLNRKLLAAVAYSQLVVVDASTTTFFSVRAMRMLDHAGRTMAAAGGELRVVVANPGRRRLLEVANCHRHLRTFPSLAEALAVPQRERQPQAA
jgi:anti-anti-sigma factor